jgi:hypothetical protein
MRFLIRRFYTRKAAVKLKTAVLLPLNTIKEAHQELSHAHVSLRRMAGSPRKDPGQKPV